MESIKGDGTFCFKENGSRMMKRWKATETKGDGTFCFFNLIYWTVEKQLAIFQMKKRLIYPASNN